MPDDALADRLSAALDARTSPPVDVEGLLTGSRRRARQVRNRRIGLGTASVVLVIALPVTIETLRTSQSEPTTVAVQADQPRPLVTASQAVQLVPPTRSGVGPATSSTSAGIGDPRSVVATVVPAAGPAATGFPYAIPDSLAFTESDLPAGMHLLATPEQSVLLPIVHGQVCRNQTTVDVVPVAGRQWTWTDTGLATAPPAPSAVLDAGASVTLTITGWSKGSGEPAFGDLVANSGRCMFTTDQRVDTAVVPGYQGWIATSTVKGRMYGRAAVRIGDLIAGIEVRDAAGDSSSGADVKELAQHIVEQLASAHFVAP